MKFIPEDNRLEGSQLVTVVKNIMKFVLLNFYQLVLLLTVDKDRHNEVFADWASVNSTGCLFSSIVTSLRRYFPKSFAACLNGIYCTQKLWRKGRYAEPFFTILFEPNESDRCWLTGYVQWPRGPRPINPFSNQPSFYWLISSNGIIWDLLFYRRLSVWCFYTSIIIDK